MDRICDNLQYFVSECFVIDKYLNCFFRVKQVVKYRMRDCMVIQCVFVNAKISLININILMIRVGKISSLGVLSQNMAQISIKHKLYRTRKGCESINLLALVMCTNAQVTQITVPISHFQLWCWSSHRFVLSVGGGGEGGGGGVE